MEKKILRYALAHTKEQWLEADAYRVRKDGVYAEKPNPVNRQKLEEAIEKADCWWNEYKTIKAELEEIA